MSRSFCTILISLALGIKINAQVYTFEGNDTLYLQKQAKLDNFSEDYWYFRDDLPAGKYYQIRKHDCGIDTLRQAEFSEKGVKDGIWKEWTESFCVAADKSISTHTFTKAETYKHSETIFEGGYIRKHTLFQLQSNLPLWEFYYPANSTFQNDWNVSKLYKSNHLASQTTILLDPNTNEYLNQTVTYDEFKNQIFSDTHFDNKESKGSINFYQNKNLIQATGKYIISQKKSFKKTYHLYSFVGKWFFFNESNEHVANIKFRKGRLSKIEILNNNLSEFDILNWLDSLYQSSKSNY